MMRRMTTLLITLLVLGTMTQAQAALRNLEQAYELVPGQLMLPAAASGNLTVHRCPGCAAETLQLDAHTEFQVLPGTPAVVDFDTLRRKMAQFRHRPRTSLFVYYDPVTRIARRIVLDATQ